MATRFPMIVHDGHLIADLGRHNALLDTGSPGSIGDIGSIEICDKRFELSADFLGVTAQGLADQVGYDFSLLIGMDLIGEFDVTFSSRDAAVTFEEVGEPSGEGMPLDSLLGVPVIDIEVGDEDYKAFFDTGAPISYLPKDIIEGYPLVGTRTDFYPTKGTFEVSVRQVPIRIANDSFEMDIGEMDEGLASMIGLTGIRGIIGSSILELADVTLSMVGKRMRVTKLV